MMELQVTLEFTCLCCKEAVNVTVLCKGKGSSELTFESVAAVNVPCPTCGEINRVLFEANGTLRGVRPIRQRTALPVPSIN
jgi:hypothetical protein